MSSSTDVSVALRQLASADFNDPRGARQSATARAFDSALTELCASLARSPLLAVSNSADGAALRREVIEAVCSCEWSEAGGGLLGFIGRASAAPGAANAEARVEALRILRSLLAVAPSAFMPHARALRRVSMLAASVEKSASGAGDALTLLAALARSRLLSSTAFAPRAVAVAVCARMDAPAAESPLGKSGSPVARAAAISLLGTLAEVFPWAWGSDGGADGHGGDAHECLLRLVYIRASAVFVEGLPQAGPMKSEVLAAAGLGALARVMRSPNASGVLAREMLREGMPVSTRFTVAQMAAAALRTIGLHRLRSKGERAGALVRDSHALLRACVSRDGSPELRAAFLSHASQIVHGAAAGTAAPLGGLVGDILAGAEREKGADPPPPPDAAIYAAPDSIAAILLAVCDAALEAPPADAARTLDEYVDNLTWCSLLPPPEERESSARFRARFALGARVLGIFAAPLARIRGAEEVRARALSLLNRARAAIASVEASVASAVPASTAGRLHDSADGGAPPDGDGGGDDDEVDDVDSTPTFMSLRSSTALLSTSLTSAAMLTLHLPVALLDAELLNSLSVAAETLAASFSRLPSSGYAGGRADVARAVSTVFCTLASDASKSATLAAFASKLVPAFLSATLAQGVVGDALSTKFIHPISGARIARPLFEMIPFWRELVALDSSKLTRTIENARGGVRSAPPLRKVKKRELSVSGGSDAPQDGAAPDDNDSGEDYDEDDGGLAESDEEDVGGGIDDEPVAGEDALEAAATGLRHVSPGTRRILARARRALFDALLYSIVLNLKHADLQLVSFAGADNGSQARIVEAGDASVFALSIAVGEAGGGDAASAESFESIGAARGVSLVPSNKPSYDTFLNSVDFIRYCLPLLPPRLLVPWMPSIIDACECGITRAPHASGWYTALSTCVTVASQSSALRPDLSRVVQRLADDAVARAQSLSGELRFAAIAFSLCLPRQELRMAPQRAVDAIRVAFNAGAGAPELATLGVESMLSIAREWPSIRAAIPTVIPSIVALLEGTGETSAVNVDVARVEDAAAELSGVNSPADDRANYDQDFELLEAVNGTDEQASDLASLLRRHQTPDTWKKLRKYIAEGGGEYKVQHRFSSLVARRVIERKFETLAVVASDIDEASSIADSDACMQSDAEDDVEGIDATDAADGVISESSGDENVVETTLVSSTSPLFLLSLCDRGVTPAELSQRSAALLGDLGAGAVAAAVETSATEALAAELSWREIIGRDSGFLADSAALAQALQLRVNWVDALNVPLPLDRIVPRVLALACGGGLRATKVAAAELFHALVSLVSGQLNGEHAAAAARLLRAFSPLVLTLAVDSEPVASQLFSTLARQLAHLIATFPASALEAGKAADVFLVAAFDALRSANSALRDFAAVVIADFANAAADSTSDIAASWAMRAALERLLVSAYSRAPAERVGACLAWTHIADHVGRVPRVADAYALELLHLSLSTLRVADRVTAVAACAAIDAAQRVVEVRAVTLVHPAPERAVSSPTTLPALIAHLLGCTRAPSVRARRRAMDLFDTLAPVALRAVFAAAGTQRGGAIAAWDASGGTAKVWLTRYTEGDTQFLGLSYNDEDGGDVLNGLVVGLKGVGPPLVVPGGREASLTGHVDAALDTEPATTGIAVALDVARWLVERSYITAAALLRTRTLDTLRSVLDGTTPLLLSRAAKTSALKFATAALVLTRDPVAAHGLRELTVSLCGVALNELVHTAGCDDAESFLKAALGAAPASVPRSDIIDSVGAAFSALVPGDDPRQLSSRLSLTSTRRAQAMAKAVRILFTLGVLDDVLRVAACRTADYAAATASGTGVSAGATSTSRPGKRARADSATRFPQSVVEFSRTLGTSSILLPVTASPVAVSAARVALRLSFFLGWSVHELASSLSLDGALSSSIEASLLARARFEADIVEYMLAHGVFSEALLSSLLSAVERNAACPAVRDNAWSLVVALISRVAQDLAPSAARRVSAAVEAAISVSGDMGSADEPLECEASDGESAAPTAPSQSQPPIILSADIAVESGRTLIPPRHFAEIVTAVLQRALVWVHADCPAASALALVSLIRVVGAIDERALLGDAFAQIIPAILSRASAGLSMGATGLASAAAAGAAVSASTATPFVQEVLLEARSSGERSLRLAAVALLPLLLPGASSTAPAGAPIHGVTPVVEASALAFARATLASLAAGSLGADAPALCNGLLLSLVTTGSSSLLLELLAPRGSLAAGLFGARLPGLSAGGALAALAATLPPDGAALSAASFTALVVARAFAENAAPDLTRLLPCLFLVPLIARISRRALARLLFSPNFAALVLSKSGASDGSAWRALSTVRNEDSKGAGVFIAALIDVLVRVSGAASADASAADAERVTSALHIITAALDAMPTAAIASEGRYGARRAVAVAVRVARTMGASSVIVGSATDAPPKLALILYRVLCAAARASNASLPSSASVARRVMLVQAAWAAAAAALRATQTAAGALTALFREPAFWDALGAPGDAAAPDGSPLGSGVPFAPTLGTGVRAWRSRFGLSLGRHAVVVSGGSAASGSRGASRPGLVSGAAAAAADEAFRAAALATCASAALATGGACAAWGTDVGVLSAANREAASVASLHGSVAAERARRAGSVSLGASASLGGGTWSSQPMPPRAMQSGTFEVSRAVDGLTPAPRSPVATAGGVSIPSPLPLWMPAGSPVAAAQLGQVAAVGAVAPPLTGVEFFYDDSLDAQPFIFAALRILDSVVALSRAACATAAGEIAGVPAHSVARALGDVRETFPAAARVIEGMAAAGGAAVAGDDLMDGGASVSLPSWIAGLLRGFDSARPLTTRLLVARIVLRRRRVFAPWAQEFAPALMLVCLDFCAAAKRARDARSAPLIARPTDMHATLRDVADCLANDWTRARARDREREAAAAATVQGAHALLLAPAIGTGGFFAPRAADAPIASAFLDLLVRATPTKSGRLFERSLSSLDILISMWCSDGALTDEPASCARVWIPRTTVRDLVLTKEGRVKSSVFLSYEGACVATGLFCLASVLAVQPLDDARDAGTGDTIKWPQVLADGMANPSYNHMLYKRFAAALGEILKKTEREAALRQDGAADRLSRLRSGLVERLIRLSNESQTQSGAHTTERGALRFLTCAAALVSGDRAALITHELMQRIVRAVHEKRGRASSDARRKELSAFLVIAESIARSGTLEMRRELLDCLQRDLGELLHVRVGGFVGTDSLQVGALRVLRRLVRSGDLGAVAATRLWDPSAPADLERVFARNVSTRARAAFYALAADLNERVLLAPISVGATRVDSEAIEAARETLAAPVRRALLGWLTDADPRLRELASAWWDARTPDGAFATLESFASGSCFSASSAAVWPRVAASALLRRIAPTELAARFEGTATHALLSRPQVPATINTADNVAGARRPLFSVDAVAGEERSGKTAGGSQWRALRVSTAAGASFSASIAPSTEARVPRAAPPRTTPSVQVAAPPLASSTATPVVPFAAAYRHAFAPQAVMRLRNTTVQLGYSTSKPGGGAPVHAYTEGGELLAPAQRATLSKLAQSLGATAVATVAGTDGVFASPAAALAARSQCTAAHVPLALGAPVRAGRWRPLATWSDMAIAKRDELAIDMAVRSERPVSLARTYFVGELPDAALAKVAVIAPLTALAALDANVARELWAGLWVALYASPAAGVDATPLVSSAPLLAAVEDASVSVSAGGGGAARAATVEATAVERARAARRLEEASAAADAAARARTAITADITMAATAMPPPPPVRTRRVASRRDVLRGALFDMVDVMATDVAVSAASPHAFGATLTSVLAACASIDRSLSAPDAEPTPAFPGLGAPRMATLSVAALAPARGAVAIEAELLACGLDAGASDATFAAACPPRFAAPRNAGAQALAVADSLTLGVRVAPRSTASEPSIASAWAALADLYEALGADDIVSELGAATRAGAQSVSASSYEAMGNFEDAADGFRAQAASLVGTAQDAAEWAALRCDAAAGKWPAVLDGAARAMAQTPVATMSAAAPATDDVDMSPPNGSPAHFPNALELYTLTPARASLVLTAVVRAALTPFDAELGGVVSGWGATASIAPTSAHAAQAASVLRAALCSSGERGDASAAFFAIHAPLTSAIGSALIGDPERSARIVEAALERATADFSATSSLAASSRRRVLAPLSELRDVRAYAAFARALRGATVSGGSDATALQAELAGVLLGLSRRNQGALPPTVPDISRACDDALVARVAILGRLGDAFATLGDRSRTRGVGATIPPPVLSRMAAALRGARGPLLRAALGGAAAALSRAGALRSANRMLKGLEAAGAKSSTAELYSLAAARLVLNIAVARGDANVPGDKRAVYATRTANFFRGVLHMLADPSKRELAALETAAADVARGARAGALESDFSRALILSHATGCQALAGEAAAWAARVADEEGGGAGAFELRTRARDALAATVEGRIALPDEPPAAPALLALATTAAAERAMLALPRRGARAMAATRARAWLLLGVVADDAVRAAEAGGDARPWSSADDAAGAAATAFYAGVGASAVSVVRRSGGLHVNYSSAAARAHAHAPLFDDARVSVGLRGEQDARDSAPRDAAALLPAVPAALLPRALALSLKYASARRALEQTLDALSAAPAAGARSLSQPPPPPLFTLLPWASQILAFCAGAVASRDDVCARALARAALMLGCAYPQALFFPFRVTAGRSATLLEMPLATCADAPMELRALAAELRKACPQHERFAVALSDVYTADVRLPEWVSAVSAAADVVRARAGGARTAELSSAEAAAAWAAGPGEYATRAAQGSTMPLGEIDAEYWAHWASTITPCARLNSRAIAELGKLKSGLKKPIREAARLEQLSPWLAKFSAAADIDGAGTSFELPGQYDRLDGSMAPRPSDHITLSSAAPEVFSLTSMRRPKRVLLVGSDGRMRALLIKGGEDLRLDARVVTLLRVADDALADAARGAPRMRTFAVTPIAPDIGLIEWVPHTTTLKTVIERAGDARLIVARNARRAGLGSGAAAAAVTAPSPAATHWDLGKHHGLEHRQRWLERVAPKPWPSLIAPYGAMYASCVPPDEAARVWREEIMPHSPHDLLRDALRALAPSAEALVALRSRFVGSLSALTAALWVLGVGDRHLDNFLFDSTSGDVIAIDFGAALGAATSALPVPETMPARLTPNLLAAAGPLPTPSLVRAGIARTLRALRARAHRGRFLALLDVFTAEPQIEWRTAAARRAQVATAGAPLVDGAAAGNPLSTALPWIAGAKVLTAALKLRGAAPGALLILDLLQNRVLVLPDGPASIALGARDATMLVRTLSGLRAVVEAADAVPSGAPPRHALVITPAERACLEATTGARLDGRQSAAGNVEGLVKLLSVNLQACTDENEQAAALVRAAAHPSVLLHQWQGIATWV